MSQTRRYWLLKSEPGCFSISDLQNSPQGISSWDGVRNYQARNLLRDEIRTGDGILFYHSNIPEPAIVGVARVVRSGYPDHTARDPRSEHFDPRSTEASPIWFMVDVQYVAHLPHALSREDLRRHPALSAMEVLKKGSRLSVQPVSAAQWRDVLVLGGRPELLEDL
ncbi:MAG: EVE domain-containing protein [Syntrophotalea acetylenica]|jgi:predicted RNA-binding protein with PUA-like domain|uniref:EVE domain-containing protein n=1 Tax=Syntrophotalea acetylenica TaxID=29542 RepID=A0A1L3GI29_SYNAC|nr:EVE domain-containing protein [Syntrophotalea acetylenica]APG25535.1 EVE domain-containing protein [Syntrophotalea acetylenica]APG43600.1 EVE domain-containing protein [Syntrophotalea acetylenica]MDD4457237.1 EVE domain-containing protein [Syntrophotalea acetylenica]MDY0262113.1 EVE domain-containing protein [Syntrophotalea acetylenica]